MKQVLEELRTFSLKYAALEELFSVSGRGLLLPVVSLHKVGSAGTPAASHASANTSSSASHASSASGSDDDDGEDGMVFVDYDC